MNKVRLVYRESPQTGVPQLEDPTGRLAHADLQPWESELNRRYHDLASADGQVVVFATSVGELPNRFRVRVKPVQNRRCPVLELETVDERAEPVGTPDLPEWLIGFGQSADELLQDHPSDRAERAALAFVLEELRELGRNRAGELTILLLAGYLYMAESQCLRLPHGTEQVALYRLASRVLDAWCANQAEDAAAVPRQSDGSPAASGLAYQWMSRMLARLLGLQSPEAR